MFIRSMIIFILLAASLNIYAWNLNDVSILFKLPQNEVDYQSMLKPSAKGFGGELLTKTFVKDRIGGINNASAQSESMYENLRAVAFRFDPCPPLKSVANTCLPEVRIVWQPVYFEKMSNLYEAEDAGIHTFYRLNSAQYKTVIAELLHIKNNFESKGVTTESVPLGVHPALLNEKTRVEFLGLIQKIILKNAGEGNFYKVTAVKLLVPDNWWKFMAEFEKDNNGVWQADRIPRHGGDQIDILNDAVAVNPLTKFVDESDTSLFIIQGPLPIEDDLRYIVSSGFRKSYSSSDAHPDDYEQFKVGIGAVNRLQNPALTNSRTVDCAHCHFAEPAHIFAVKTFPELQNFYLNQKDRFQNPDPKKFNLKNTTDNTKSTKIVRAFGYMADKPSIMTRVIFESADVANWLNQF